MRTVGAERAAQQPPRTDEQIERIAEEGGPVAFNQVPEKLKRPANDEQRQGPAPVEEKERQRNDNQRNANAVCEFVQRMAMLGLVVIDEGFGHLTYLNERAEERGQGGVPSGAAPLGC